MFQYNLLSSVTYISWHVYCKVYYCPINRTYNYAMLEEKY